MFSPSFECVQKLVWSTLEESKEDGRSEVDSRPVGYEIALEAV